MSTQISPSNRGGPFSRAKRVGLRILVVLVTLVLLFVILHFGMRAWFDWQHVKKQHRIAAAVEALPAKDARMTLYSLEPMRFEKDSTAAEKRFHHYYILGEAEITAPDERAKLLTMLAEDIKLKRDRWMIQCFEPRHGLRISTATGDCDFVICFSCRRIEAHNFASFSHVNITSYARAQSRQLENARRPQRSAG